MATVYDKLEDVLKDINQLKYNNREGLVDVKNKLLLYISKFFKNDKNYLALINDINSTPANDVVYERSVVNLRSLTRTLQEDAKLSNADLISQELKDQIIEEYKQFNDEDQYRLTSISNELKKSQEQLKKEREDFLNQQKKFDEFKSKLELADKSLDFQSEAVNNKKNSLLWACISGSLILLLLTVLIISLNSFNSFSKIANSVKKEMGVTLNQSDSLTTSTIYFTYGKYIFTKVLLYSMILYAIVFCVKNYNAQMHNHIINIHKSNAFKSTLSLLNTAKSDDGNDKLLIQATQAIFSHQQTGYNGSDAEPNNPNLVTNVIEATTKKI